MDSTASPRDDGSERPTRAGTGPNSVPGPPFEAPLRVVLYQPEIAPNVGAVGRTCVAAGASLWLVRPLGFVLDDRHLRRAGMDYWSHLTYHVVDDLEAALAAPGAGRAWYFTGRGRLVHTDIPYAPGDLLVFGPESRGLPARLIDPPDAPTARIPIRPEARSLNLSVAVGIAVFEALRQVRGRVGGVDQAGT